MIARRWLNGGRNGADPLRRAAELILSSRYTVALTGAGISTPSGIPDYRSPGSGLWETVDPLAVASASAFRADPQRFFQALGPLAARILAAQPNAAHIALADLEALGLLSSIITQNVDNLHQRAGSRCVWEIHGHLREATCLACGRSSPCADLLARFVAEQAVPRCPHCGGILKPNVVLFGDPLPRWVLLEVAGELERCELLLVIGSSLEVAPACELPHWVLRHGGRVVIINDAPTSVDAEATLVIRQRAEEALPALASLCQRLLLERPQAVAARSHADYVVALDLPPLLSFKASVGRWRARWAATGAARWDSLRRWRPKLAFRPQAWRVAPLSRLGDSSREVWRHAAQAISGNGYLAALDARRKELAQRAQDAVHRLRAALPLPQTREKTDDR